MDLKDLSPGDRRDELTAIAALIRAAIKPVRVDQLATLIDLVGSAVELIQLTLDDVLFSTPEVNCGLAGTVSSDELDEARIAVDDWLERGIDVRSVLDPCYPHNLHSIFDRPPIVFLQGSWREQMDSRSIAIVGTRNATDAGLKRATLLASELAEAGFTINSGLAAGIDTAVHTSTLEAGGRTVAVMGTGLDHCYPSVNRKLATRIVDAGGALLSQFFPHQTPRRWTFPMRNVVMSGLSLTTVVVEASKTSGARMQARVAMQHGRAVFLLKSLVESYEWAREYVEDGAYGAVAIEVGSTNEILERLEAQNEPELSLTA